MSKEYGDCSRGEAACWCSFEAEETSVMCVRVVPPTQEWLNLLQSHTLSLLKLNSPKQRTSLQTGSQRSAVIGMKREISHCLPSKAISREMWSYENDIPFSAAWNGWGLDCECESGCLSHWKEVLAMTSSACCSKGSNTGQMVSKETLHHTASANLFKRNGVWCRKQSQISCFITSTMQRLSPTTFFLLHDYAIFLAVL